MTTQSQRGAVLPLTLIIMLVLVGLVTALLAVGVSEPLIAGNLLNGSQAFHVAEAGVDRTFGKMYSELPPPAGVATSGSITISSYTGTLFNGVSFGAGAYTVTVISNTSDTVTFRSTGTGPNGATRTIEAIVTDRFDYRDAIITNDDLTVTGNGCVQGSLGGVHSNNNLTVDGSVVIDQNATASKNYSQKGNAKVKGPTGGNTPKIAIPDLQPSAYKPYATIVLKSDGTATDGKGNSITVPNDWKWNKSGQWDCCSGNGTDGIYYIEGDVHVSSSPNSPDSPWRASLIVTGHIDISGNPSIAPATDPSTGKPFDIQFLAGTDLSMGGSPSECTNCLAGLIYAREQFNINGNVPIRGAIMALDSGDTDKLVKAGEDKFSGSACVILNAGLRVPNALGPLRILSWRLISG